MRIEHGAAGALVLSVALTLGLWASAGGAPADSGSPSGLLVRYEGQHEEPGEVASCPGRGSGAPCFATPLPFKFRHPLRLYGNSQAILLSSGDLAPTPRAIAMETRDGRTLGHDLRVVAVDHGARVPGENYIGHRRWRIELPRRRLPEGLYAIIGELSYSSGAFRDFAFGAMAEDAE